MQFDQAGPAAHATLLLAQFLPLLRVAVGPRRVGIPAVQLVVEQIQIAIFLMKRSHFGLAWKVGDPLDVSLAYFDQISG